MVAQWQSGRQVTELGSLKTFAAILCPLEATELPAIQVKYQGIGDSVLT